MNPVTKKFATAVPVDACIFTLMYYGLVVQVPWASNLILFLLWFSAVMALFLGFGWSEVAKDMEPEKELRYVLYLNNGAWRTYDVATDIAVVVVLAALHMYVLASVYAFACMIVKGEMYKWAEKRAIKA